MDNVGLLQTGATVLLNTSFAWLAAALGATLWVGPLDPQAALRERLWRSMLWAALACIGASFIAVLCALALMGDVALSEALGMLPKMLSDTGYGRAGLASMLSMFLLALLAMSRRRWTIPAALLLTGFALARASMSHAAGHGLLSLDILVEWIHLAAMAMWIGVVAVSGWLVLPASSGQGVKLRPYLGAVSTAATLALAALLASGLFNAWQRVESPEQLATHPYGKALVVKLALVGIAACMGLYNRMIGFPAAPRDAGPAVMVLRLESAVLLAVLAAAAMLTLQEPPR